MHTIHTVKLKQSNMLCNRCLTNVVKALSPLEGIKELNVNLDKKLVKITYENENLSRKMIQKIINDSIVYGKVDKKMYTDNKTNNFS